MLTCELTKGFMLDQSVKNLPAMQETPAMQFDPGLGGSFEGYGNPLQYSCLKNSCLKKFHGQRSLTGYSSRDHNEFDKTWRLTLSLPSNSTN